MTLQYTWDPVARCRVPIPVNSDGSLKVSGSGDAVRPEIRILHNRLTAGIEPMVITCAGDSTGNESGEWFYRLMSALAAKYPAYTVVHRLWNDVQQIFDPWRRLTNTGVRIQTGTAGDAYFNFPATSGSYVSCPSNAKFTITGDIDVRAKINLNNWATGVNQVVMARFNVTGDRSWYMYINSVGRIGFGWTEDGTTLKSSVSGTAVPAVPADQDGWFIRTTLDVDNGASGYTISFYYSADGQTWTSLGTATGGAVTSIFSGSTILELGSRVGGTTEMMAGKIFEAQILSGIDGKVVASPNFDQAFPAGTTTFKDAEGNTWTVNGSLTLNGSPGILVLNGAHPGAALAYAADSTRVDTVYAMEPAYAFVSYSHNDSNIVGSYGASYQAYLDQIKTKWPNATIICVTQNPRKSPATNIGNHAIRCTRIIPTIAAKNDYPLLDAFAAYQATPNYTNNIGVDGIHPTAPDGFDIWVNVGKALLNI